MASLTSKGLVPQLTDVLQALTQSQRLLIHKLQTVQVEGDPEELLEVPARRIVLDFADFVPSALPADERSTPALAAPSATPPEAAGTGTARERVVDGLDRPESAVAVSVAAPAASRADVSTPSRDQGVQAHPRGVPPTVDTVPSVGAPEPPSVEETTPWTRTDDVVSIPTPPPSASPVSPDPHSTPGVSARRYNFFDDLDASITGLGRPESASDDG